MAAVRLSIVIPTLRRHAILSRALDRLERQEPRDFEVIVVDDPYRDSPEEVTRAIGTRRFPVRQLSRRITNISAARNDGWRAARAPLVMFIGDDILPLPGFLERHLARHEREPAEEVAVLGRTDWARELRVTPFMRWLDRGVQFDYGGIEGEEAGWGRFYTSNVSLKRSLLERSGGFDEEFGIGYEDLELGYRLHKLGMRLLYEPAARAEHLHPQTLDGWRHRMTLVAPGERLITQRHPELPQWFRELFLAAMEGPPARGRGARLAALVPPHIPWLGPRVWASADAWYRQQLAPAFLAAWDREEAEANGQPEAPDPVSRGSGPK